ncbi:minor histocompatibility antigen H13 isoform X2 [Frankliniella occidentalis]|uniref:Minor histocompatibility antigen H13 isoform X2 n=1 Tax=Frankliniella occidentalis TaxID=133901 RepID=A0A6J1SEW9_FRAOC|nr:minor histocompatibility antigen H13 isoform X2 [Frankliniella occidentalis]
MADVVEDVVSQVKEFLTDAPVNGTRKTPATPEGMAMAYTSLVVMAVLPIFFGSLRSVRFRKVQMESGAKPETMTRKDAAFFPLIASAALFGLYLFFKIFSKEYVNLLLTGYFFILGIITLTHLASPLINTLVPAAIPNIPFHLHFKSGAGEDEQDIVNYKFSSHDIVSLICCSIFGAWYLWKKHWVANNLFGIAFAISGVEMLHLNNIVTGCILLCGLFVYDIFWVFGTNVMVTVANSFEAPIKLVFPQDLLEKGLSASNFAMLGLGDIVIPGIFVALLLRFDHSLNRNTRTYFYSTLFAYLMGLLATIFVMHVFKHAQPALLYLVPACISVPVGVALIKGDIRALFAYEDYEEGTGETTGKKQAPSKEKKQK